MGPLVLAVGLLLAVPTVRGAVAGQIDPGTALARFLMGLAVAWAGVSLVRGVVARHVTEPAEEPVGATSSAEAPPG